MANLSGILKLISRGGSKADDVVRVAKGLGSKVDNLDEWQKAAQWFVPGTGAGTAAKSADEVVDVIKGVTKGPVRKFLGTKTAKFGLPALGLGGLYAAATAGGPPTPSYDPTKIAAPTAAGSTLAKQTRERLDQYLKEQEQMIRDAYATGAPILPGAEVLNPVSALTNQMGGATLAQMQALAARSAQDAAAAKQAGVVGAQNINDIYGGGATAMQNVAAAGGGAYGGLTPVSGAAAVAPGQTREAGAALADYLRQNQLIAAQDQGFLSQLADTLGPAYANQFLSQDVAARAAYAARQQERQQQLELERQQQLQQSLAELGLTGSEQRFKLGLEELQQQAAPRPLLLPSELETYATDYENLTDQQRQSLAATNDIYSVEDYINARIASGQ